jgi:hypothetical protein
MTQSLTVATITGVCTYFLGLMTRVADKYVSFCLEERKEKKRAVEALAAKLLEQRRELFERMGSIDQIDADYLPPDAVAIDPTAPTYCQTQTERIGNALAALRTHLPRFIDLPEAKQLFNFKYPVVYRGNPNTEAELVMNSYKNGFLPLQAIYRKLKRDVMTA